MTEKTLRIRQGEQPPQPPDPPQRRLRANVQVRFVQKERTKPKDQKPIFMSDVKIPGPG